MKGKFNNEANLIIANLLLKVDSFRIYSGKIIYKGGQESPLFGSSDSDYEPNKEFILPGKPISKIDFHKGDYNG